MVISTARCRRYGALVVAPLRSWSEDATSPDGRTWRVTVSVPYFDSTVAPENAEHRVAVAPQRGLQRQAWTQLIVGEQAAEALLEHVVAALTSGWLPEHDPLPEP